MRLPILYLCVFLTGGLGLSYEVVWERYLARILGCDTVSRALIIAVFLGCLSAGYYLFGTLSERIRKPFQTYAILEFAIGAWSLIFPKLFELVDGFTSTWTFAAPLGLVIEGLFCTLLLIGLPTILMGGTLPLLTQALTPSASRATKVHTTIYGTNTLGAAFGALTTGFFFIPKIGLPLTLLYGGLCNIGIGLIFLMQQQKYTTLIPKKNTKNSLNDTVTLYTSPIPQFYIYILAFLSGLCFISLENILIRISEISLGSSYTSFSIVLSSCILCIAFGSFSVIKFSLYSRKHIFYCIITSLVSLIFLFSIIDKLPYTFYKIRILFISLPFGYFFFHGAVYLLLILLFSIPIGSMGALLPMLYHHIEKKKETTGLSAGVLLSWNTLGNLSGSFIGGIILFLIFDIQGVFFCILLLLAVMALISGDKTGIAKIPLSASLALSLVFIVFTTFHYDWQRFSIGTFRIRTKLETINDTISSFYASIFQQSGKPVFYRDGVVSSVAVIESGKDESLSRAIMINGKSDSSTAGDLETLKLLAHLPVLLSNHIDSSLVIGLGTGITAGELSIYPEAQTIDIAELSDGVVAAQSYFTPFNRAILDNPKAVLHRTDAFRVLKRSNKKWNLIISEPSNPWVSGVDHLFTQEFYRLSASKLEKRGLFAQWLQLYSTSLEQMGMVINTLNSIFPHVYAFSLNTSDILLIGSFHEISDQILHRGAQRIFVNSDVQLSLQKVGIYKVEDILKKEFASPNVLRANFAPFGFQTMDNPRLHYIAGRDFFQGNSIHPKALFTLGETSKVHDSLLLRYIQTKRLNM